MATEVTLGKGESLREALAGLPDGAVLCLPPGTWEGGHALQRSLTLRGLGGAGEVRLDADGRGSCLSVVADDIEVVVKGVTLTGGSAEAGGGVTVEGLSRLTLVDCIVTGNRSRQAPGGGAWLAMGTLVLRRCRVLDNTADDAPGVCADEIASLVVEDSLIAGEVGPGCAVVRVRDGADATLRRSTVIAQGRGAALHSSGTTTRRPEVTAVECILSGAVAIDAPPPFGAPVRTERSVLSAAGAGTYEDAGGTVVAEPGLSAEGVPSPGSPAIGLGRSGGTVDLAGRVRPQPCAAGAFEP